MAFLMAQIVGPTGCVIGIDKSAQALATARARAIQQGLTNVSFVQEDIHCYKPDTLFDAAVGRLVLMYQPNPLERILKLDKTTTPVG